MRFFPFLGKIDVIQNINEGMEHKQVTKNVPMDELVIQLLIEQNACITRIEHNVQLMAQMLQKFAVAATPPADEVPNA